jgi:hypothetical protein
MGAVTASMNRRTQMVLLWCSPLGLFLVFLGWWPIAGFFPPYSPSLSARGVQSLFIHHSTGLTWGVNLMALGAVLWIGGQTVVTTCQIQRVEGGTRGPLALLQLILGAIGIMVILASMTPLMVAAYRPHMDPTILRLLSDMFWLPWAAAWWPYSVQLCVIAAVAFRRVAYNPFPRWYGWLCIVVAILAWTPTTFFAFAKSGPFAWNGLYFWYMTVSVFIYYAATVVVLRRAIVQEGMELEGVETTVGQLSELNSRTSVQAMTEA